MIREDHQPSGSEAGPNKMPEGKSVSGLGLKLRAIRRKFIAGGGCLLTGDQLSREIAERRGGINALVHEEENVR